MKLSELTKNLDIIEFNASPDTEISGISYDSRTTQTGDVFVAISGFESDGHKYIPKAAEKGAAAVICEKVPETDIPYVLVKDSRRALALISCAFFGEPSKELCMIGVTGTNGKTTTTHLIKHLLEDRLGTKVGLVGTNGNMIGDELIHTERTTPESYELQKLFREMRDAGCTHVVMEVSSHSLALSRVEGIRFKIAVFTNLTQDHLDFHGTMEEYAKTKARLFSACEYGCVNIDDEWSGLMLENAKCRVLTYSAEKNEADLVAKDIRLAASGVKFCAVADGSLERMKLAIPGKFSVYNALSLISVGLCLGMSLSDCAEALATAKGVKGRMELVPTPEDYTVVIDYSHTPDALENALRALRQTTSGRLVVLFGCGGDRDRKKRPVMGKIAAENADLVIVTSDNPRTEDPQSIIDDIMVGVKSRRTPYKMICDRAEAIRWAIDNHARNDVILLAGKGHEDYQVIGREKRHMDEREIIAEHLAK